MKSHALCNHPMRQFNCNYIPGFTDLYNPRIFIVDIWLQCHSSVYCQLFCSIVSQKVFFCCGLQRCGNNLLVFVIDKSLSFCRKWQVSSIASQYIWVFPNFFLANWIKYSGQKCNYMLLFFHLLFLFILLDHRICPSECQKAMSHIGWTEPWVNWA